MAGRRFAAVFARVVQKAVTGCRARVPAALTRRMEIAALIARALLRDVRTQNPFVTLLLRWLINALGIMIAASVVPGIEYENNTALVIVVVLLGLFNVFLKPMLVFFALPFVVLTLGIGVLFINAALFLLAAHLVEGFVVESFFAAFVGALIVSALNLVLGRAVGDVKIQGRRRRHFDPHPRDRDRGGGGDVIDV
jgi:putative membrane protein